MLHSTDETLINVCKKISVPLARISLFGIYFWFGILKVIGVSSASGVVQNLFEATIPFMSFHTFFILFGIFECLIGLLFLVRGFERIVIPLLLVHMVTTFGPLIFLPEETWQSFMVPTLEGQYIIKNLALVALAIGIAAHLHPKHKK